LSWTGKLTTGCTVYSQICKQRSFYRKTKTVVLTDKWFSFRGKFVLLKLKRLSKSGLYSNVIFNTSLTVNSTLNFSLEIPAEPSVWTIVKLFSLKLRLLELVSFDFLPSLELTDPYQNSYIIYCVRIINQTLIARTLELDLWSLRQKFCILSFIYILIIKNICKHDILKKIMCLGYLKNAYQTLWYCPPDKG
jgi:hypothetical protein